MADIVDIDQWLLMRAQQFEDQHAPQNLTAGLRVAAEAITRLRAEVEKLRAALEPFAKAADFFADFYGKDIRPSDPLTVDFQALLDARAALTTQQKETGND